MKRIKFRLTVDSVIMSVASFTLATSIYFLFQDGSILQDVDQNLTAVGTFKTSENDVRRRVDSGMTWSNIDAPEKVYEGDTIFTGDKSEASITLENGNIIKIDAKSLVVIRTKGNRTEIDLQYGSLQGKIEGGAPIIISQNGEQQELGGTAGSQIRIVKTEKSKDVRVQVTKGEISLKSDSGSGTKTASLIKQDEVVQLREKTAPVVEKSTLTLVSPVDGQTKWLAMGASLDFSWRASGSAARGRSKLEFAHDNSFASPFYTAEVSSDRHAVSGSNIPQGSFYWRVKPETGEPSLPAQATALPDVPPLPVLPKDGQIYSLDNEKSETTKTVYFTWEDKAGSTEFELQVAKDADFKTLVTTKRGKEKVERIANLTEGDYFWRVTGKHPKRTSPPPSKQMSFSIRPGVRSPNAPTMASSELYYTIPNSVLARFPASLAEAGRGVKPNKITPFTWSPTENAKAYEVEVAETPDFANSIRQETDSMQFAPKEVRPGALFVRVRAKGEDGQVSPASEPAKLTVELEAPRLQKVRAVVSTYKTQKEMEKGSHEFKLAWNSQPFADSYELQWGADEEFKKSKKFRVKDSERLLKVSKAQAYVARVRSLDASGKPLGPYSDLQIASFKKEVIAPKLEPKPEAPRVLASVPKPAALSADEKLGGLVSTIPVPQLKEPAQETALISLEDAPTFVTFKWKPFKGAAFYTIQISEDADFTKVVTQTKANGSSFVFQKGLPEGKVFWRVRAHLKKGFSQWSDPYDINVIYQ